MRVCAFASLMVSCTALGSAIFAADAPRHYTIDPARSRLQIVGLAGGLVPAVFRTFSAAVTFSPDALAGSKCDVSIDMNSIDSQDAPRDAVVRGPDIFDAARYPTARYVCRSFALSERGFKTFGSLTLHGVTKDVVVFFKFTNAEDGPTLEGTAKIKRLDFGVGQGEWKSFQKLADAVTIKFTVVLDPNK